MYAIRSYYELSKKDAGTQLKGTFIKFSGDYVNNKPKGELYAAIENSTFNNNKILKKYFISGNISEDLNKAQKEISDKFNELTNVV